MIRRGALYWVDLGDADGSRPVKRRPVVVVQSDAFNRSRLATTIAAVVTSNTALAVMPGNVMLPAVVTGLPRDSVVNVAAIVTVNKRDLSDPVGQIPDHLMNEVDRGVRLALGP